MVKLRCEIVQKRLERTISIDDNLAQQLIDAWVNGDEPEQRRLRAIILEKLGLRADQFLANYGFHDSELPSALKEKLHDNSRTSLRP